MNSQGLELKRLLERSISIGIPENRLVFNIKNKENTVIKEIMLTAKSAVVINDLKNGFLNDTLPEYKKREFTSIELFDSLLIKPDTISYAQYFIKSSISDTNYLYLARHLFDYTSRYPIDRTVYTMRSFKEDSTKTLDLARSALLSKGYLKEQDTSVASFTDALKLFQIHNALTPDGKVGKHTATALNESTYEKLLRAAFVMDKMRRSAKRPKKFAYINIPEYLLRFYANDSLKSVHNIIVGTPENRTPTLVSKIHSIIVYPYWNVPHSIASKEILPAAQRNVGYFKKNHYRVYRGDVEINPYKVNWKKVKKESFPYRIVQDPGPENSLGVLKFEFHNRYSVYVHDTPSKNLFKTNIRSYSHGCMRCERPTDLAKLILTYDSIRKKPNAITPDSLDSLMGLEQNYAIKLKNWIPVYVEYNTVSADAKGLYFHLDIYRKDEEYLNVMQSKDR
jgi:L,D-transpeptidase YcbB